MSFLAMCALVGGLGGGAYLLVGLALSVARRPSRAVEALNLGRRWRP